MSNIFHFAIILCLFIINLKAEIIMPVTFGDGMVLQREKPLRIFGQATEGALITIQLNGQKVKVKATNGNWMTSLKPMQAGGPYELQISGDGSQLKFKDVMVGEVWLASGQSNMAMALQHTDKFEDYLPKTTNTQLRFLKIPVTEFGELDKRKISWKRCNQDTAKKFSAVAYHFATELQKRLGVTVAIIGSYRGGTWNENWMTPESIKNEPKLKYLFDKYEKEYSKFKNEADYEKAYKGYTQKLQEWRQKGGWSSGRVPFAPLGPKAYQRPSGLYNCMIKPLQPYTIRGCIWYQGEGNSSRYEEMLTLFPAFVKGWRQTWLNPNMPFYFVQLPPYKDKSWPHFRQSQLDCSKAISHCGMVVAEGCGDLEDIHPKTKKPIGDRLAIAVSAQVYGHKHTPFGPTFTSVTFENKYALVNFDHVGQGLLIKSDSTQSFEIAGEDKVFKTAHFLIESNKLKLWNDEITAPKYVRYAYSPYPDMSLFNKDGLPATPFISLKKSLKFDFQKPLSKEWFWGLGTWKAGNGILKAFESGPRRHGPVKNYRLTFKDIRFSYEFRLLGKAKHSSLPMNGSRERGHILNLVMTKDKVFIRLHPENYRKSSKSFTLVEKPINLQSDTWYKCEVEISGDKISAQINDFKISGSSKIIAEEKKNFGLGGDSGGPEGEKAGTLEFKNLVIDL